MHKDKNITLLPLSPMDVVKHAKEINNKPPIVIDKYNGIKLQGGDLLATTSATAKLCDNLDAPCYTMFCQPIMSSALPAVTNCLHEFVDGEESRMTSILEGGDVEDITKMESRTTPIQEGEDGEDIAMLDTSTPSSFSRCNSSPTWRPRHSWIQQTCHQCFDHNFFIRHQNGVHLGLVGKGTMTPSFWIWSQLQIIHGLICMTTIKCCVTYFGPTWPCIESGL